MGNLYYGYDYELFFQLMVGQSMSGSGWVDLKWFRFRSTCDSILVMPQKIKYVPKKVQQLSVYRVLRKNFNTVKL